MGNIFWKEDSEEEKKEEETLDLLEKELLQEKKVLQETLRKYIGNETVPKKNVNKKKEIKLGEVLPSESKNEKKTTTEEENEKIKSHQQPKKIIRIRRVDKKGRIHHQPIQIFDDFTEKFRKKKRKLTKGKFSNGIMKKSIMIEVIDTISQSRFFDVPYAADSTLEDIKEFVYARIGDINGGINLDSLKEKKTNLKKGVQQSALTIARNGYSQKFLKSIEPLLISSKKGTTGRNGKNSSLSFDLPFKKVTKYENSQTTISNEEHLEDIGNLLVDEINELCTDTIQLVSIDSHKYLNSQTSHETIFSQIFNQTDYFNDVLDKNGSIPNTSYFQKKNKHGNSHSLNGKHIFGKQLVNTSGGGKHVGGTGVSHLGGLVPNFNGNDQISFQFDSNDINGKLKLEEFLKKAIQKKNEQKETEKEEFHKMEKKVLKVRTENHTLKSDILLLKDEINKIQKEFGRYKKKVKNEERKTKEKSLLMTSSKDKIIKNLQEKIETDRKRLIFLETKYKELNLKELEQENIELKEQSFEKEIKINDLNKKLKVLQSNFNETIAKKEKEITKMTNRLTHFKKRTAALIQQKKNWNKFKEDLEEENKQYVANDQSQHQQYSHDSYNF